jgi:hypothetical protein
VACGVCNSWGHNVRTCPYNGRRRAATPHLPKQKRCQCCGQYGYAIERHHTRGRSDDSDALQRRSCGCDPVAAVLEPAADV